MFKVAKPFLTVSRRFKVGDNVVPDDCDSRNQWWGLRQNKFIEEIKADAPEPAPAPESAPVDPHEAA